MRCEDLEERLTDLLEGDLESEVEEAALEHLASCDRCERVLTATRDVVRLAQDHGRPVLAATDRARMLDAITAEFLERSTDR